MRVRHKNREKERVKQRTREEAGRELEVKQKFNMVSELYVVRGACASKKNKKKKKRKQEEQEHQEVSLKK
ncbi:hypothetical protein F2Q68_00017818 [Brassica cretica]|uniref:Uncharacterized protein n=2 Tax=Brassica cretica TaxID=69181 RepID=A0ABQ7EX00_BRACR|nr:hypothetical protein F2Q68_00017818 [Brassica cretica]KAF3608154.1 hypothetical protein DY000_02050726 [Brassica cretica]